MAKAVTIEIVSQGSYDGTTYQAYVRDIDGHLLAQAEAEGLRRAVRRALRQHERKLRHAKRYH